jgi:hypothetical protein
MKNNRIFNKNLNVSKLTVKFVKALKTQNILHHSEREGIKICL